MKLQGLVGQAIPSFAVARVGDFTNRRRGVVTIFVADEGTVGRNVG